MREFKEYDIYVVWVVFYSGNSIIIAIINRNNKVILIVLKEILEALGLFYAYLDDQIKIGEDFTMNKRACAEMVAEMVGLDYGMFWKQQHILIRLMKHLIGSIFQKIISNTVN